MAMTGIKVKSKPLDQVRADVPVDEVRAAVDEAGRWVPSVPCIAVAAPAAA